MASQTAMHAQQLPSGGAAAAAAGFTAIAPETEAPVTQGPFPGMSQAMGAQMTVPQSMRYPSVADLEVAGEQLGVSIILRG